MTEFALIDRLAGLVPTDGEGVLLSIGDDGAILQGPGSEQLVVSTDTLNAGVHFLDGADPRALGHKALAVNLSDLAAMGATPRWALLNLSMPRADSDWLDGFAAGFGELARLCGVVLVGGDTCRGSLSIAVTVLGVVPEGRALRRDGAEVGDRVYVSGTLGDAALALRERLAGRPVPGTLAQALDLPKPQLALGEGLRSLASACIDLSDGLLADLGHLAARSGLSAEVRLDRLPTSTEVQALDEQERYALQLTGGEDYGLCFSVLPNRREDVRALAASLGITVTEIGEMLEGSGVRCALGDGGSTDRFFDIENHGWDHFRELSS